MRHQVWTTYLMLYLLLSWLVINSSAGSLRENNPNKTDNPTSDSPPGTPSVPCIVNIDGKNYTCREGQLHPRGNHTSGGQYPRQPGPSPVRENQISYTRRTFYDAKPYTRAGSLHG